MKNKFLLLFIITLFLCGCDNYRELNNIAIITGVSLDKVEDKYEVGLLIANSPKQQTSSKEGEAQTTVYTAKGSSIASAIQHIDYKSPKKLYFGHINVVIISEAIGKEGFLETADFLLRYPETRKKFFLMQSKDCKPKDILKIVSPLESFPSQSIATLLKSTRDTEGVLEVIDYSTFISKILENGYEPTLPVITISGNENKGEKSKNIESTEPEAYIKLDSIAIYKNGKFQGYENFKEGQNINIINNNINELKITFKYKNKDISFGSNQVSSKVKINNPKNITINVSGKGFISEINTKDNLENPKTIKKMEKNINKTIKKRLYKTIKKMQTEYQSDVFGFGNKIYKKYPKKWKKIENHWNDKYFPNLEININTNFKINSVGSLDRTIKEVKGWEK